MRSRTAYLHLDSDGYTGRVHADDLSSSLRVDVRTARRWIRGGQAMPYSARRLAEILFLGVLPWPDWRGFTVDPSDKRLRSGNGYGFSRGSLEHWGLFVQRVEARARSG